MFFLVLAYPGSPRQNGRKMVVVVVVVLVNVFFECKWLQTV